MEAKKEVATQGLGSRSDNFLYRNTPLLEEASDNPCLIRSQAVSVVWLLLWWQAHRMAAFTKGQYCPFPPLFNIVLSLLGRLGIKGLLGILDRLFSPTSKY